MLSELRDKYNDAEAHIGQLRAALDCCDALFDQGLRKVWMDPIGKMAMRGCSNVVKHALSSTPAKDALAEAPAALKGEA
jgi:hypothetical protein